MAINKHFQSFDQKGIQVIDCELQLKAMEEASIIIQSFPGHFLFTPSDNGYINEQPVNCPTLTQVFKTVITEGHSIVFSLTEIEFIDFIKELFSNNNVSIESVLSKYRIQTIPSNSTNKFTCICFDTVLAGVFAEYEKKLFWKNCWSFFCSSISW